jgi:hypothetical protein
MHLILFLIFLVHSTNSRKPFRLHIKTSGVHVVPARNQEDYTQESLRGAKTIHSSHYRGEAETPLHCSRCSCSGIFFFRGVGSSRLAAAAATKVSHIGPASYVQKSCGAISSMVTLTRPGPRASAHMPSSRKRSPLLLESRKP